MTPLPLALVAATMLAKSADERALPERIVTAKGAVTEIVFALGEGRRVVAVDTSSTFPDEVKALPKIGYHRSLSAEGVLSLRPDLVLVGASAGPPSVLEQIRAAGVRLLVLDEGYTKEAAIARIRRVAAILGRIEAGERLIASLEADLARALKTRGEGQPPRVVFLYAQSNGALRVSGTGTAAESAILLAGGHNAVNGYEGYRPLSAEALIAARPDVILLPMRSLPALGGLEKLLKAPGVAMTPAAKAGRIYAIDDLLVLGFGPRLGEGVLTLSRLFFPVEKEPQETQAERR